MTADTYSYARMLELAGEPDENGWRTVTINVRDGETAVNPASTKRVVYGPCRIRYDIHPSGVHAHILDDDPFTDPNEIVSINGEAKRFGDFTAAELRALIVELGKQAPLGAEA